MGERHIPTSEELEQASARQKPTLFSRLRHGRLRVKPGAGEAKKVNAPGGPVRPVVETQPNPTPAAATQPADSSAPDPAAAVAPSPVTATPKTGRPINISSTVRETRGAGVRKPGVAGTTEPIPAPVPTAVQPPAAVPPKPVIPTTSTAPRPAAAAVSPPAPPKVPPPPPVRTVVPPSVTPPVRSIPAAPRPSPPPPVPASLHAVAQRVFGKVFTGGPQRFSEPTWTHEGGSSVGCVDCDGELHVFRRPYESAEKQYRYWGFACSECARCFTLDDFDSATQQRLKGEAPHAKARPQLPTRVFTNAELVEWALSRACSACQAQLASGEDGVGLHQACRKAFEAARVLRSHPS